MSSPASRLVHRFAHPNAFWTNLLWTALLSVGLFLAAALIFYLHAHPVGRTDHADDTYRTIQFYIAIVGVPLVALLLVPGLMTLKRQSVVIDDIGIRFDNGGWLGGMFGTSWALRWPEIDHADWQFNSRQPRASRLALKAGRDTRTLAPWMWTAPNRPIPTTPGSFGGTTRAKFLPILEQTPIVQGIVAHRPDLGLGGDGEVQRQVHRSGLIGATPLTGLIAATMVFGVGYFILEIYFTLSDFYVNGPPWGLLAGVAVAAGALMLPVLKRAEPERRDSPVYAFLFALAIGFIAYPFSIRLNQWTAPNPPVSVPYQLGGDYLWHPKNDTTLPALSIYLRTSRWWRQFGPGDTYHFTVQRGGLGDWLIDMHPVYEAQQNFYHCHGALECMRGGH
ncbi:hypothetical protein A9404_10155 [Halothiobacillus diazotrophicus]|uniref:Uncharacterized protein n=1 Tax=Halothiobacillus diazotrophicus TaxID=1860122 RepID=A0A191ZIK0_9GAMM|nr:hypothetical protein [Halothiobacillus diazotrophicus]ANJ67690.1 hypothetical protein A9404_10155 [Halothiobacillus diazotrophicus]